jgi:hypothetical protein
MLEVLKSFTNVGASKLKRSSLRHIKINSKKRRRPVSKKEEVKFGRDIRPKWDDLKGNK